MAERKKTDGGFPAAAEKGYFPLFVFAFFSFFLLAPAPASGADWPTFRGNERRTGFTAEQAYPPLTKIWDFHIQGDVISSPVVYDGVVYVGARSGSVYAINANTGELIWDYSTGGWVDASCTVYGSAVYVPSRDGYLYALDKDTGNLLWKATLGAPSVSSPLYHDGRIYVGTGVPENKLKVFSAENGNLLWEYNANQPIDSSPSTDGNAVFFGGNDGRIYAMEAASSSDFWPSYAQTYGSFQLGCLAVSSGNVYALPGHDEKKLYILSAADGSQIAVSDEINVSGEAEVTSPLVSESVVYFGMGSSPHTLYGYRRDSLEGVWASSPTFGNTWAMGFLSSPSMANEVIYAGTADGRLVAVSSSGVSVMTDISLSTSSYTSPAVSNGKIFVGRQGGRLYAFKAAKIASISSPREYEIIDTSAAVRGYVANPNLSGYSLEYGGGEYPSSWTLIISTSASSSVEGGLLGDWDTSSLPNGIYTLKLTVNESAAASTDNTARVRVRINHPPAPPANLSAEDVPSDSGNRIQLSWEASTSTNITEYRIYRKAGGAFSELTSVSSSTLSYIDSAAVTGTTYTYRMRSYDGFAESPDSNEASAYSVNNDPSSDSTPPSAVGDLAASPGSKGGYVSLSWTAPGNDGDIGTASHYIVRYSTFSTSDFDSMTLFDSSVPVSGAAGTAENADVTGLYGGVTYYFALKTSDFNGNLSGISNIPSSWATVDSTPPASPAELSVSDTPGDHGGSLTLTWKLSSDDGKGENDVYGYKIFRRTKTQNYDQNSPYAQVEKGISKYIDASAPVNVRYYYRVAAFDSSNDSEMSDEADGVSADNWRFMDASNGGIVRLADGAEVSIPKNGVNQNDNILMVRVDTETFPASLLKVKSASAKATDIIYEIKFENPSTKLIGLAEVVLPYTDSEIAGLEEENLRMYTYSGGRWKMFNNSEVLAGQNKVKAATTHFSYFRIMQYVPSGELLSYDKVYTYPNPARGDWVTFKFYVADKSYVVIDVYNVAGEKVARLEKANCPAGIVSEIKWNVRNYASGVYIYKVEANSPSGSKKVVKKLAIIH